MKQGGSNLQILVRLFWKETMGSLKYSNKRKSTGSMMVLFVVVGLFLLGSMAMSAFGMSLEYEAVGVPQGMLFYALQLAALITLLMGLMRGIGTAKHNDADMLLPLPLKRNTIILAKSVSKYLIELAFPALIFLPYVVVYFVRIDSSLLVLLRGLLVLLLLPLLAVGLSYLLSTLFFKLGNKIRNPQAVASAVAMLSLVAFMYYNFTSAGSIEAHSAESVYEMMNSVPPVLWAVNFIYSGSLLGLLGTLLLTALPFALGVMVYARIFGTNQKTFRSKDKTLRFKQRSPLAALMHNERTRYMSSSLYLINTIFGLVLMLALTVLIAFLPESNSIMQLLNMPEYSAHLPLFVALMYSLFPALSCISASSISMEGKRIWILRSLPVSTWDIFKAKLYFHLQMVLPLTLLCSVATTLLLGLPVSQMLLTVLVPLFTGVAVAVAGLMINLRFPKLEWDNEAAVVKQSMAAGLTMLVGFLIAFVPFLISLGMTIKQAANGTSANLLVPGAVWLAIVCATLLIYLLRLRKNGAKRFAEL